MDFSVADFTQVARSNWFNNDIVLSKDGSQISSKFFHTKSTKDSAKVANKATMDAFQKALVAEFGAFGKEAFDELLKTRGGKSLRKNDILKTVKAAEFEKTRIENGIRAVGEETLGKILRDETRPFHRLSDEMKTMIRGKSMAWLTEMLSTESTRDLIRKEINETPEIFEDLLWRCAEKILTDATAEKKPEEPVEAEESPVTYLKAEDNSDLDSEASVILPSKDEPEAEGKPEEPKAESKKERRLRAEFRDNPYAIDLGDELNNSAIYEDVEENKL